MRLRIRILGIEVINIEVEATTTTHEADHEHIDTEGGPPFGFSGSAGGHIERSGHEPDEGYLGWSTCRFGSPRPR